MNYKQLIELDGYINLWEVIPEDEHNHISNKIWEALDRAGIICSQDAELSIKIYDEELKITKRDPFGIESVTDDDYDSEGELIYEA